MMYLTYNHFHKHILKYAQRCKHTHTQSQTHQFSDIYAHTLIDTLTHAHTNEHVNSHKDTDSQIYIVRHTHSYIHLNAHRHTHKFTHRCKHVESGAHKHAHINTLMQNVHMQTQISSQRDTYRYTHI